MLKSGTPQLSPSSATSDSILLITEEQRNVLEAQFSRNRIPRISDLELLAAELGLDERDVEAWYAIRMDTWRKEQGLPTSA